MNTGRSEALRRASRVVARLLLVLGIILSPLRATAATVPALLAYDAAVGPTATTVPWHDPVRSETAETEGPAINDYDGAHPAHDGASNVRVLHAYDDAREHTHPREVRAEGVIYAGDERQSLRDHLGCATPDDHADVACRPKSPVPHRT
jgi:hypothetical protein